MRLAAALALGAGPVLADEVCAPQPPVMALAFDSRYAEGDDTRSVLDAKAEEAALAALDPLDSFLRDLADLTETMLMAQGDARVAAADCIVAHLAVWAAADALSDQRSETVRLTIGTRLASAAIALNAARGETADLAGVAASVAWLHRRVSEQMQFWETAPQGAASGNLRAWAALAAAAVADMADDPVMRGWAAWSTTYVLCSADDNGALPQEMTRDRLALHYQLHALAPLSLSVLLLKRQGVDLTARCDAALQRAAQFALGDLETGAATQAITGTVQSFHDGTDTLADFQLAWLEPYLALTDDAQAEAVAAPRRPLRFSKLGGNQTLLWGQP